MNVVSSLVSHTYAVTFSTGSHYVVSGNLSYDLMPSSRINDSGCTTASRELLVACTGWMPANRRQLIKVVVRVNGSVYIPSFPFSFSNLRTKYEFLFRLQK